MPRKEIDPYNPGRPPLVQTAAWIIPTVAMVWAIADIAGAAKIVTIGVLFFGLVALLGACWLTYRNWQTHVELPAMLRKNLRSILHTELLPGSIITSGHGYGTFLKPGPANRVVIKASGLPPMEGETAKRVIGITGDLCENIYILDGKKSSPGKRVVLKKKPKENKNVTQRQRVEIAIQEGINDIFPKNNPKVACAWDADKPDEDYLLEVKITGVNGMDLSLPGKRRQVLVKLRTRLPKGNFISDVDPGEDSIYFHRSKPLPSVVVPPKQHAPLLTDHKAYASFSVPLGVGDNGVQAIWYPKRDAHLLIIGGTGGGKTICEHGVIQRLTQAGWRTWLVDGKRIEFIGYRGWQNVELLAQKVDHQIRVLKLAHETMEARYDLIEKGLIRVEDLDPIAIVVDELTSLLMSVKRRYQDTKGKGMTAAPPVLEWVADIARLGRSAKMHLVLGLQRPDASIMGGEMRDNFGGRISLGKLQSKEASMMMWDDPGVGVSVPNIKGRAVSWVNGALGMVQGTFTANPDPHHDDYHAGMVESMRPLVEAYSRKNIAEPVPSGGTDGDEVTWADIIQSQILDSNGKAVIFDPVSSEESKRLRREYSAVEASEDSSNLQAAESFAAALALFSYDPLTKIAYGNPLARKLATLAEDIQPLPVVRPEPEIYSQQLSDAPLPDHSMSGKITELRYVEPGQSVVLDELGGEEIIVSSCEIDEDDPEIRYLNGYTAEGEAVHLELPANTKIEAFELEDA